MRHGRHVLFLCQRLPFPPNKGEKITSFNLLRHLGQRFDVHVGTFVDNREDASDIDGLRPYCATLHVERIVKPWAWVPATLRWLGGAPLSFAMFRADGMRAYVRDAIARYHPVAIVTHSSNISDYALLPTTQPTVRVLHFADVDSEKFADFARQATGWQRWLYALEASRVRAAETRLAAGADAVAFVSDEEADLFRSVVAPRAAQIVTIANGVDAASFDPQRNWPRPDWGDGPAFVFTGAMDYRPNIDAVNWFADAVLPELRASHGAAQFAIVGSNPSPAVTALATRPGVLVTGRVPDVQPYLSHAAAAVAPLRIARGIQNKVLEALSMGRPTIVTSEALTGIGTPDATPVIVADGADAWLAACRRLLDDPDSAGAVAARARAFAIEHFGWDARLRALDALLPFCAPC
ncbi:MAG TPA: TIGR03087 family PEP-CTERM/XrtA system glycosyltransferase [Acetobacteraceae bacterium]|nr:TIGR03087 family PEP-CTERM/XrtA system glycosyltransferase [Acetobacteraceae bacterium]